MLVALSVSYLFMQGAMDLKYLSTRCSRGKAAVAKYQETSHRYVGLPSLADAHSDLLKFQSACGGSPHSILCFDYGITVSRHYLFHLSKSCLFEALSESEDQPSADGPVGMASTLLI